MPSEGGEPDIGEQIGKEVRSGKEGAMGVAIASVTLATAIGLNVLAVVAQRAKFFE